MRITILFLLIFLLNPSIYSQDREMSWIKVDGNKLTDESGEVFVFKGIANNIDSDG